MKTARSNSRPLTLSRADAVARMSDAECETPITKLLENVGLHHLPLNGIDREVRRSADNTFIGYYSAERAISLYVEIRDEQGAFA